MLFVSLAIKLPLKSLKECINVVATCLTNALLGLDTEVPGSSSTAHPCSESRKRFQKSVIFFLSVWGKFQGGKTVLKMGTFFTLDMYILCTQQISDQVTSRNDRSILESKQPHSEVWRSTVQVFCFSLNATDCVTKVKKMSWGKTQIS